MGEIKRTGAYDSAEIVGRRAWWLWECGDGKWGVFARRNDGRQEVWVRATEVAWSTLKDTINWFIPGGRGGEQRHRGFVLRAERQTGRCRAQAVSTQPGGSNARAH